MSNYNNGNYKVQIQSHGNEGGIVTAWLPEQFALRLQNKWEQYFANIIDNKVNAIASHGSAAMSAFTNKSFFIKALTGHVWMGTEAIEFQLQLQFDANTDIDKDVFDPISKLIIWSSPSEDNGAILTAPGPNLISANNRLSLRIGKFLYFDSVIIPNMDITWHSMMHESGIPIAADVEISFRTFYTMTRQDIMALFSYGRMEDYNGKTTSSHGAGFRESLASGLKTLGVGETITNQVFGMFPGNTGGN